MQLSDGPARTGGARDDAWQTGQQAQFGGAVRMERRRRADGQQQQGAGQADASYGQLHGQQMKPADLLRRLQQQQASSSDKL